MVFGSHTTAVDFEQSLTAHHGSVLRVRKHCMHRTRSCNTCSCCGCCRGCTAVLALSGARSARKGPFEFCQEIFGPKKMPTLRYLFFCHPFNPKRTLSNDTFFFAPWLKRSSHFLVFVYFLCLSGVSNLCFSVFFFFVVFFQVLGLF